MKKKSVIIPILDGLKEKLGVGYQGDVAEIMGVSQPTVSRWHSGKKEAVNVEKAAKLFAYYHAETQRPLEFPVVMKPERGIPRPSQPTEAQLVAIALAEKILALPEGKRKVVEEVVDGFLPPRAR